MVHKHGGRACFTTRPGRDTTHNESQQLLGMPKVLFPRTVPTRRQPGLRFLIGPPGVPPSREKNVPKLGAT